MALIALNEVCDLILCVCEQLVRGSGVVFGLRLEGEQHIHVKTVELVLDHDEETLVAEAMEGFQVHDGCLNANVVCVLHSLPLVNFESA